MADGRHFEIVKAPYLNQKLSDFDEISYVEANSDNDDSHFTKIQNFLYSVQNSVLVITQHRIILFLSNFV